MTFTNRRRALRIRVFRLPPVRSVDCYHPGSALAHGSGAGKWRNIDCATLALQEDNGGGGMLASKGIKHLENLTRENRKTRLLSRFRPIRLSLCPLDGGAEVKMSSLNLF
ncbi:hypothetical protein [Rhizobium grahamii]|uniref:hypothetical protein n=1 Tax=Rhizobium grahamii TaxID=1120045 RepID=UPI0005929C2C|nr:hypothetical protein [Rhizobium grahamii]